MNPRRDLLARYGFQNRHFQPLSHPSKLRSLILAPALRRPTVGSQKCLLGARFLAQQPVSFRKYGQQRTDGCLAAIRLLQRPVSEAADRFGIIRPRLHGRWFAPGSAAKVEFEPQQQIWARR